MAAKDLRGRKSRESRANKILIFSGWFRNSSIMPKIWRGRKSRNYSIRLFRKGMNVLIRSFYMIRNLCLKINRIDRGVRWMNRRHVICRRSMRKIRSRRRDIRRERIGIRIKSSRRRIKYMRR